MTKASIVRAMLASVTRFRHGWLVSAAVGIALIGLGLTAGQWDTVKRWADILCTGCIGLTFE